MANAQTYDQFTAFTAALKHHLVRVMGQPVALAPCCRHAIRLVQLGALEKEPQFAGSGLLEFGQHVTSGQLVAKLQLERFLTSDPPLSPVQNASQA